jgi:predicted small secreted protein
MKSIFLMTVATMAVLFSSCNTMIGIGRDLRMGGEGLENSANKAAGGGASSSTTGGSSAAPVY